MKNIKFVMVLFLVLYSNESFSQKTPVKITRPVDGSEVNVSVNSNPGFNPQNFSNNFPDKMTSAATISYSPTGVYSLYDLQSNSCPQEIWQDPLNPGNVHAIFMYSDDPNYFERSCYYVFSSNFGASWIRVTNIPSIDKSGFPSISGLYDGRAVVGLHVMAGGPQQTKLYYNSFPGSNAFTELIPGGTPIWPKVLGVDNNKIIFAASPNNPSGPAYTNTVTNFSPPGTFSGWVSYSGDISGNYTFAKSQDGKIGHAFTGDLSNLYDVFYRFSTDNGLTWSTNPVKIWDWDLSQNSLGCLNGVGLVYGNNNEPYITFNTSILTEDEFFPRLPSSIRVWSPAVNGGIPIVVADSSSVPFFPNKGNTNDQFLPLC